MAGLCKVAFALVAIGFAFNFCRGLHTKYVAKETEALVVAGMSALAFERIDPYRERFVADEVGCALILRVYSETKKFDRLEWAIESCVYRGIKTFDTLMARAQVLLNSQQLAAGITSLRSAKNYRRWTVYPTLINALLNARQRDEALIEMKEALKIYPDIEALHSFALHYYSDFGLWPEAAVSAQVFKQPALEGKLDPDFRALVAKAFEKSGDTATAKQIRGQ